MTNPAIRIKRGGNASGLKVGYIATVPIPSRQTDTEQVVRTVDALSAAGVETDLIVPASASMHEGGAAQAIRRFYHVAGNFKVFTYPCMRRIALEAERILCAMVAGAKFAGRYDIVHTRSRGIALISVLKRRKVVFETYRDLSKTHPWFLAVLRVVARSDHFLGVVTHSHFAAAGISPIRALKGKVHVIHNGYDPAVFNPDLTKQAARERLGYDLDTQLVVYAGNVQRGKGMSVLLEIAARLKRVRFVIVGGSREHLARLDEKVKAYGCENVVLVGWKRHDELGVYLQAADILIIPPTAAPLERYRRTVLPMKTFLLAGAGRVIVAPDTPDIGEVLTNDNAVLVPPDDIPAAVSAISHILVDEDRARELGERALETASRFTWAVRAQKLKTLYEKFLNSRDMF